MLYEFLLQNKTEVLERTQSKSAELAGTRPSSEKLREGLPIFFDQLTHILRNSKEPRPVPLEDRTLMAEAAASNDEKGLARAAERQDEIEVAESGGIHGAELMRLGYTLSHVVHAYGAMCQAITGLANEKHVFISPIEFHDLNRCLDVAIAGAVSEFQFEKDRQRSSHELEQLGFLAHELRNALNAVNISVSLIKKGTVGFGGSTAQFLERGLKRIEKLVDRSLSELRLRMEPRILIEAAHLLQVVDQINISAEVEAERKQQTIRTRIDPALIIQVDQHLFFSALSNLIQNAIKFSPEGGVIEVRAELQGEQIVIEVEDQCGGLTDPTVDLFKPFVQHNVNKDGLGLGLTIARRAITLNQGTLDVQNLPGKGCIFRIKLPRKPEILPLER